MFIILILFLNKVRHLKWRCGYLGIPLATNVARKEILLDTAGLEHDMKIHNISLHVSVMLLRNNTPKITKPKIWTSLLISDFPLFSWPQIVKRVDTKTVNNECCCQRKRITPAKQHLHPELHH